MNADLLYNLNYYTVQNMKKGQNLKIMFTFIILIAKKRHFIEKYDIYNKKNAILYN